MAEITDIKTTDRTIEIVHPAKLINIGVRVSLMSIDDERMEKTKRSILDRRLHLEQRGKHFKAEEIEENKLNLFFATMIGWDWYGPEDDPLTFHGEKPDFNRKNAIAVMRELPWFADQISEAIGDTQSFFAPSERS